MTTAIAPNWRKNAVCATETSDAPEAWTSDKHPAPGAWVQLEQMCHRCPVRRRCAAEALATGAETGVYAGVWVPAQTQPRKWAAAMERLERIAKSAPSAGTDQPLGVPA